MKTGKSIPRVVWLAAIPILLLAGLGHWQFWYHPRLRPAVPGDDLPSRILRSEVIDTAVWMAHPHQNLPALSDLTGLDATGLEAVLRLAGADAPKLRGAHLPPASSLAVGVARAETGETGTDIWVAAAKVHPLAAGFLRLAGALASNPWLGGGEVPWASGDLPMVVTIAWRGTTWTATTDPAIFEQLDQAGESGARAAAVAWIRHQPAEESNRSGTPGISGSPGTRLLAGVAYLLADEGQVRLESRPPAFASSDRPPDGSDRLQKGRRVLDAAEALLVLLQRARPESGEPDQSMLLLPLPPGTDESELPRSAVLFRPLPGHEGSAEAKTWDLPGEKLLEIAGHDLPRGGAAGWKARATDAVGLGSALAAAPELRTLGEVGMPPGLPGWGLWLDVVPASVEIDRLARGLEASPFLRRDDRQRWQDAAIVLRSMARRPARIEGYVSGQELLLRWSAPPTASPSG